MKRHFLIFSFLLLRLIGYGAEEYFSDRIPGSSMEIGSTIDLYDDRYLSMNDPFWVNEFYNKKVLNKVSIGYEYDNFPLFDVDNSVKLQIDYWHLVSGVFVQVTEVRTLSLSHRLDGQLEIDNKSTFVFEGAHRVRVSVLDISGSNTGNIYVETEMDIERYYAMQPTVLSDIGHRYVGTSDDYLEFYWDPKVGAESYDLEWTFVSDYDYNTYSNSTSFVGPENLSFDFYKNSTRVNVLSSYYRIPAIFNHGYIVYRVRAIGRQGTFYDYRKEGPWSLARSGVINTLTSGLISITSDYEQGKNWQYQAGYSEEGKRMESVGFLDGLGRGRQMISHNIETEQAVVNNVYYDRIGRAVVSDLPTPVDGNELKFYLNFNYGIDLNNGGLESPYGFIHYDYDVPDVCSPVTNPFSASYGTGKYYSSNPNQQGANVSIPDAGGYPFSQVEYMNDQTGRVRRSGSYGLDHQLNGHSTQFFYDIPLQSELNKMFGTEVGTNGHYQRQITIDANGQGYASYYDLAGRVVASCLVGEPSSDLDPLENNTGPITEETLIYEGTDVQITDATAGIATYSFLQTVLTEADYSFNHSFTPEEFGDECLPEGFCYDCFYDLTLDITNTFCPGEGDYHYTETINGWTVDAMCNGAGYDGTSAGVHLLPGQYNVSKELRVSEGAAEAYWCNFISNSSCSPSYSSLYNSAYSETDFGCALPIDDGSDMNTCDKYRRILAIDMSLGGQYGSTDVSDALSIYNTSNTLPNGGSWRSPIGNYLDDDGNIVKIYVSGSSGNYSPSVYNESLIMTDADGGTYIYPENLADFSDYESYWRFSWSYALVGYHPEYCYLKYCDENLDFHLYDQEIGSIDGYDEACLLGYTDPIGSGVYPSPNYMNYFEDCGPNTSHLDPYFVSTEWAAVNDYLNDASIPTLGGAMDKFFKGDKGTLSLWEYAVWMVHCSDYTVIEDIKKCIKEAELTECEKDQVWVIFRDEYRKLRKHYYLLAQTFYVSYPDTYFGGGCGPAYNGCIGTTGYDPTTTILTYGISPAFYPDLVAGPIAIPNTTGPCASTTASSYSSKSPRFENLPALGSPSLPSGYSFDPTGLQNYIDDLVDQQCETQCEAYADEWMSRLEGCYTTTEQREEIRAALIEVCIGGCSAQNPTGATTDDPSSGSPLTYSTFGEVLAALGDDYQSAVCSEYLISSPRPFGQNDVQQAAETNLESCGCDKLLQAELDFEQMSPLPLGVTSVEDMLEWSTGVDLLDAGSMICACKKAFGGTWSPESTWSAAAIEKLKKASIPAVEGLTCESCASCELVQEYHTKFLQIFAEEEDFVNNENYEELFTNFMNNSLGYHLTLDEYETFMEGCQASSGSPLCTTTSLGLLFKDLLDVIARQGKLTVEIGDSYDMGENNIVYQYSNLASVFNGDNYWTCGSSCGAGTLTMHFGSSPGEQSLQFNLPPDADFDFGDIIGVTDITAINKCGEDNIELEVRVIVCGEIVTRYITGYSKKLELVKCYCEKGMGSLCDELPYGPASPCYANELIVLASVSESEYESQIEQQHDAFVASYIAKCSAAFETEKLTVKGPNNFYQFTLFYYDQSGNLVKTVAPKGAKDDVFIASNLSDVDANREAEVPNVPTHTYETKYEYNSYNQLVATSNPDQEGSTKFWYDRYGRIVASQNPLQASDNQYSYSLYDPQGRPIESGQVVKPSGPTSTILTANDLGSSFANWVQTGTRTEVNRTQYDQTLSSAINGLFSSGQQNLRLRVASVFYYNSVTLTTDLSQDYASAIHYSYDQHGNVLEQLQDVPQLAVVAQNVKRTQYEFELISGNVKRVKYQAGERDQMTHRYKYDLLNRLTEVLVSTDGGIHESREAHYRYYDYGPLARTEIGEHKVQGMDYAYTINGWIKGMNSNTLIPKRDLGNDGVAGYLAANSQVHENVARDVAGYTLGYFPGDYKGVGAPEFEASLGTSPVNEFGSAQRPLYNGNISHLVTAIEGFDIQATAYSYDQLQRLKKMRVFRSTSVASSNDWTDALETSEYSNAYSYDENGNLKKLSRNGTASSGLLMDNFEYHYQTVGANPSNRLNHVDDSGADDAIVTTAGDIKAGMITDNYAYDEIGQLIKDQQEGIGTIEWLRGSKKVKKIIRNNGDSPEVEFEYDPFGIRILKIVKPRVGGVIQANTTWTYTYYTHDANGQNMAVYGTNLHTTSKDVTLKEQPIYGASRIGLVVKEELIWSVTSTLPAITEIKNNVLGSKHYEITNYLGNVNVVITDRKVVSSPGALSSFEAVIIMKSDYYPFGMAMPGRSENSADYRYGYNGMELDNELKGEGNSYTTEFRQYDPRLGRWLSLDPLMMQFPWMSPYVAFDNNPIFYTDPYGLSTVEGGPPDAPENPVDAQVLNSSNGKMYSYDANEKKWFLTTDQVDVKPKGFQNDKYYRWSGDRYEECGIMYKDAYSGKIMKIFQSQYYRQQHAEAEERINAETSKYIQKEEEAQNRQQALDYNMSQNIFGIMYKISLLSDVVESGKEASEGNYLTAGGILLLGFLPGDDIIKSSRKIYKTTKITVGIRALSKKIGRGDEAFKGIKKATQEDVEKIINDVMNAPNRSMNPTRNQQGREVLDIFNLDTKQGIRLDLHSGEFETFVNHN